jgi:hypothetical protein
MTGPVITVIVSKEIHASNLTCPQTQELIILGMTGLATVVIANQATYASR